MTTYAVTVTLNDAEIDVLVQALEHHAFTHQQWLLERFGSRERSIDGILGMILRLRALTYYSPMAPMVFDDGEVGEVEKAIKDYSPVCEREGSNVCPACERPYSELPAVLVGILPRLEYGENWTQTSGFIPGDAPGQPSTIWIKE
jgi:hypothetical protein